MKKIALFLIILFTALPAAAASQQSTVTLSNDDVNVTDGDSLYFGNAEVRLLCLDAVELHQSCKDAAGKDYPCGEMAQKAMAKTINGQLVHCHGNAIDKYQRPLVRCRAGNIDLSRAMIEQGWAVATCKRFNAIESEAMDAKRGIWQGTFEMPHEWRKAHPWKDQTAEAIPPTAGR